MLQPAQLKTVARRFPQEIATLRDFFQASGWEAEHANSLSAIAARLRESGSFRRDLSSHLMIFAHAGISPADLLGIVALAAGDATSAAAAKEQDAHDVLRFILSSTARDGSLAVPPSTEAMHAPWRWGWPVAIACLLASILAGTVMGRHRSAAIPQHAAVVVEAPAPALQQPSQATEDQPEPAAAHPTIASAPRAFFRRLLPRSTSPGSRPLPSAAQSPARTAVAPATQPQEARSSSADHGADTARVLPTPSSPAVEARTLSSVPRGGAPAATPAAVLSQRLDARTMPTDDPAINQISGHAYPRLWRRHPVGAPTPDASENTLLASNLPPSRPGAYSQAVSSGTVHPVSLGTMAANIVYSPAPAYPQAAATARVQGQVTIQAEVDRDGSVASARVVSGPPLLRDAALDAVLHWRYHPRTVGGRPVTAAATAMLEFELP